MMYARANRISYPPANSVAPGFVPSREYQWMLTEQELQIPLQIGISICCPGWYETLPHPAQTDPGFYAGFAQ